MRRGAGLLVAALVVSSLSGAAGGPQPASGRTGAGVSFHQTTARRPAPREVTVRVAINGRRTTLSLEDYVARVVTAEGEPRAPEAALQALAITARTFALANLNRHRREGYDLCDTTHCQVVRPATEAARRAAEATAGRVLMHEGRPASVFYSASCGGHSELASRVWPGAPDEGAVAQEDEACRDEPPWTTELSARQIERALREAGLRGRLRGMRVAARNASGRVARLRVDGLTPSEISGHDFRMAVGRVAGPLAIRSTAFELRRSGSTYRFTGRGFGHGVGLCVIGAGRRAPRRGVTAEAILAFYFPRLRVEPYRRPGALTAAPAPARAAAAAAVQVEPHEMAEPERAGLLQLVRAARDDIAARAGVKSPPSIRVTVHDTVEAFSRATGRPWWDTGAAGPSSIDLPPLAVLRQRAQLERAIRHEVAHVLVDRVLEDRPLWVREGAAAYFADPDATVPTSRRLTCPADEELLRPVSAGAHRSARARAEACFRRAIGGGKQWRDVR